jgi:hypothetical protein
MRFIKEMRQCKSCPQTSISSLNKLISQQMIKTIKFYIITCLVLFTSCLSANFFLQHDQIPSDFGKNNKPIFIIPSSKDRINKITLNAFEKYYKGQYSYVTNDDVLRKSGYSFCAYIDYYTTITTSGHIERDKDIQFQLKDLKTGKVFETFGFGYPKTKAKYYIQALELVRQRNQ